MQVLLDYVVTYWKGIATILIPICLAPIPIAIPGDEAKCGAMVCLMALYWMLDLLPMAATALIPVALCPLLGIMGTNDISMAYFRGTNMLFLGGLIMAAAVEHCQLHRRVALNTMLVIGTSPRLLMLSIMVPTAFLSMWISNTATTAMMVPIMEAIVQELHKSEENEDDDDVDEDELTMFKHEQKEKEMSRLRGMLAMSICYSANVGGTATVIGSTPNLAFMEYLEVFPDNPVSFGSYMGFAVPQAILCLAIVYFWLQLYFFGMPCGKNNKKEDKERQESAKELIRARSADLGPMSYHEWSVLTVFGVLVSLWFFREPKFMDGWASLLPDENDIGMTVRISDGSTAILMSILLFFLPAKPYFIRGIINNRRKCDSTKIIDEKLDESDDVDNQSETVKGEKRFKNSPPLIDWKTAQRLVSWEIIILIGGGFALAEVSNRSCFSAWIGSWLSNLGSLPDWVVSLIGALLGAAMTQILSNSASAGILLPILRDLALELEVNPLLLMFPCMLMCSYAFMLPVSTGPNAIAFRSSGLRTIDMIKLGFVLNLACLVIVMACTMSYGYLMFDLDVFPEWAQVDIGGTANICGY